MYLTLAKSCVVEALQNTFNSSYPDPAAQNVLVSIEYPIDQQSYPSIWVTYEDSDPLEIAGIDHKEFIAAPNNTFHEVTRWTFAGTISMTAVALSSLERDNLYDQLVRVYAFSRVEEAATDFRTTIENNDFVGLNVNWDQLRPFGDAATPGTPWGTDEVIYEKSLSFDVEGEFVSDPSQNTLVALSAVVIVGANIDQAAHAPHIPITVDESEQNGFGTLYIN